MIEEKLKIASQELLEPQSTFEQVVERTMQSIKEQKS